MAYIGLAKPYIAKYNEGGAYSDGFKLGKAIGVDIDPQYAEGSLEGDNATAEYDKEFINAKITLNTTTLPIEAHGVMFGHTVSEDKKEITDKSTDEAQYVGFGIYVTEKVDGVRKYIALWVMKAKFTEGKETYKTKGKNIEYQTPSISGQAIALDTGEWRERKIFDTEEEADTYLKGKAKIAEPVTQAASIQAPGTETAQEETNAETA